MPVEWVKCTARATPGSDERSRSKSCRRAFQNDPDRLARLRTRGAACWPSLNHPHIGAIYGLEDADGVPALVLELVEGETLADRIERGPVPVR